MTTAPDGSKVLPEVLPPSPKEAVQRWRLVLARDPIPPEAQREQQAAWEGALVASGLPLAGLDAPKPRARFALAAPLGAAIPGEAELLDLWLTQRLPVWRVREALDGRLPPAWHLRDLYDVWLGEAALPGRVAASAYRVALDQGGSDAPALRRAAADLLAAERLPRERPKGDGVVAYDLRPFLDAIDVDDAGGPETGPVVRMTLRHDPERGVGRPEELLAALGEAAGGPTLRARSIVRERLVLADPAPPTPPPPRRRPAPGPGSGGHGRPRGRVTIP